MQCQPQAWNTGKFSVQHRRKQTGNFQEKLGQGWNMGVVLLWVHGRKETLLLVGKVQHRLKLWSPEELPEQVLLVLSEGEWERQKIQADRKILISTALSK